MHLTRTLFFTLICTFFATHAADDKIITLQSNDGTCITLPRSAAKHSVTLSNLIEDCPSEQAVALSEVNTQELTMLIDVLHIIHQRTPDNAVAELRNNIHRETELTLSYLDSFFVIPLLEQALLHDIAAIFALKKNLELADKSNTLQHIFTALQETYDQHNVNPNELVGMQHIACIIKNAQINNKKQFLESAGTIKEAFFTGVSAGECAAYNLIDLRYKDRYYPFEGTMGLEIYGRYINSLDSLICTNAQTKKKKTLWIKVTNVLDLPANCFQRVQNPTDLLILYNSLKTIHPDAFAGLYTLKKLTIWNDTLLHIPLGTFDQLLNLEEISLGKVLFNPLLLKYCYKLKSLYLKSNQLTEMPPYWPQACTNLKNMSFNDNNISSIPPLLCKKFPPLETLYLAYNNIPHIHSDIFKNYQNLTFLNLRGNPIPQEEITALRAALPHINIQF